MPFFLQILLVLCVLSFCWWLLTRQGWFISPFREIAGFVAVMLLLFWALEGFGVLHTGAFSLRR